MTTKTRLLILAPAALRSLRRLPATGIRDVIEPVAEPRWRVRSSVTATGFKAGDRLGTTKSLLLDLRLVVIRAALAAWLIAHTPGHVTFHGRHARLAWTTGVAPAVRSRVELVVIAVVSPGVSCRRCLCSPLPC